MKFRQSEKDNLFGHQFPPFPFTVSTLCKISRFSLLGLHWPFLMYT